VRMSKNAEPVNLAVRVRRTSAPAGGGLNGCREGGRRER
jgi:hypothetical protein